MPKVVIVVPCFNEAERFNVEQAETLLTQPDIQLVLVDDGSTDGTWALLQRFAENQNDSVEPEGTEKVLTLRLPDNRGKAEAVRQGMVLALEQNADITGYLDADFATPATEMLRLVNIAMGSDTTKVLLGARWLHLGANIERSLWRHYAGRVFATLASMVLDLKVYDTQCGAKVFRASAELEQCLKDEFISKWAFDVELIGRLRYFYEVSDFIEVPLGNWVDVAGSKLSFAEMLQATLALWQIYRELKKLKY